MCTAISMKIDDSYFGRNLDYEHKFGESIVITPRNYVFSFRNGTHAQSHYAIIGMALEKNGYPLYFDAVNEKGLGIAGLNFPMEAYYKGKATGKENVASFELIPKILSFCANADDAKRMLENINITDEAFDGSIPPSPLHWFISDGKRHLTCEQTRDGMKIYENPVGVLTNSPSFDVQMTNLSNYMHLSASEPENRFSDRTEFLPYSRGMGAFGLPGDLSSMSRFVKCAFTKLNLVCDKDENSAVCGFFHALYSVYQQRGCVKLKTGLEQTNYSCCCNLSKGIYYYTTYNSLTVYAVDMFRENLGGKNLIIKDISDKAEFIFTN